MLTSGLVFKNTPSLQHSFWPRLWVGGSIPHDAQQQLNIHQQVFLSEKRKSCSISYVLITKLGTSWVQLGGWNRNSHMEVSPSWQATAKPSISRASSLWTLSLCTTYTKPQPPAGLTAGRPERHKNATSLKAALNLTLELKNSSREPAGHTGGGRAPGGCSTAALVVGVQRRNITHRNFSCIHNIAHKEGQPVSDLYCISMCVWVLKITLKSVSV